MLSKRFSKILIHNCYLVIFTGKRTGQFFIDKSVSLTTINMCLLVRKVLIMVVKLRFSSVRISKPQIRR